VGGAPPTFKGKALGTRLFQEVHEREKKTNSGLPFATEMAEEHGYV